MPKFQSLKGFRDFYPEDFATRAYITDTWRRVAKSFGFLEYDAPPLETLELYRHKSGDELVGQLYSFVDKGGREVALRPEMTPSVARMVAERWQALPKPVRWFSIPQLFRYERPQAGRLREHFQFNADIFGDASVAAEAELLALLISALEAFELTPNDVQIRLSDRRVLNTLLDQIGIGESLQPVAYSVLDKYDREDRDLAMRRLIDAGISQSSAVALFEAVEKYRNASSDEEVEALFEKGSDFRNMWYELGGHVSDAKRWITLDLAIVRGLGYYTGTVFEVFDTRGEYRAICGGGRYDALIESLGGPRAPAIGLGWGDVVLASLLRELGKLPPTPPSVDFLIYGSPSKERTLSTCAHELRAMGYSARSVTASLGNKTRLQVTPSITARFHVWIDERAAVFNCETRELVPHRSHSIFFERIREEIRLHGRPSPARIWEIACDPRIRYISQTSSDTSQIEKA